MLLSTLFLLIFNIYVSINIETFFGFFNQYYNNIAILITLKHITVKKKIFFTNYKDTLKITSFNYKINLLYLYFKEITFHEPRIVDLSNHNVPYLL